MGQSILQALREWRNNQARIEGVEVFRVFPNAVLDAIVGTLPRTKEEMLSIKGIKEGKFSKYGKAILSIVRGYVSEQEGGATGNQELATGKVGSSNKISSLLNPVTSDELPVTETISVSQFLDGLNVELSGMASRVQGEVSSVDVRERVIYFTLKDSMDGSTLNCLMFRYQYEVSGVEVAIGDEIIVEGVPEIYKPSGRLSLKVGVIELFGEGALKKAYDALKKKLEEEGLFAPERKRALPEFAERIALITSEQGAAIGDFTMNLGAQGMKVDFYPVSVEGKKSVFEVIKAVRYFNRSPERYNVLVIVRGGGSLESLQAFNNEALTREISASHIPTLCGIGHEKDVTLAALVADVMVSTPTAAARTLRAPWEEARQLIRHFRSQLPVLFRERLAVVRHTLAMESETLLSYLRAFRESMDTLNHRLAQHVLLTQAAAEQLFVSLKQYEKTFQQGLLVLMRRAEEALSDAAVRLNQYDPERVLKLGYSLVRKGGRILKDVSGAAIDDILDIQLGRGKLETKVTRIIIKE